MNTINNKPYKLDQMLAIYKRESSDNMPDTYLEEVGVEMVNGEAVLGSNKPLTKSMVNNLALTLQAKTTNVPSGLIPKNLIYTDSTIGNPKYIYFFEGGKKQLNFTLRHELKSGEYATPNLLIVFNRTMSIYAVKDSLEDLNPDTELYNAPYPNLGMGSMCTGSVPLGSALDSGDWTQIGERLETLFFQSKFSHGVDSITDRIKGSGKTLMKKIKGKSSFPKTALMKPTTGSTLLKHLTR